MAEGVWQRTCGGTGCGAGGVWQRRCRWNVVQGLWRGGGGVVEGARRIQTCKQSLSSGLFIASGAVELATEEEALDGLGLQGGVALVCREVVILHSIRRPQHLALLKAYTTTPRAEHCVMQRLGFEGSG